MLINVVVLWRCGSLANADCVNLFGGTDARESMWFLSTTQNRRASEQFAKKASQ
jgi:hypothetical protein